MGDKYLLADHLVSPRLKGLYTHHGLYIGNEEVIHYSGLAAGRLEGPVELVTLHDFEAGQGISVRSHAHRVAREDSVALARERIGEKRYSVLFMNCEHFVTWCIEGLNKSQQVEDGMVLSYSALQLLSIGNLALGVETLRQTREMREDVRGLGATFRASLRGVERELQHQSALLEQVLLGQDSILHGLRDISRQIEQRDLNRRVSEFKRQWGVLFERYEELLEQPPTDARKLAAGQVREQARELRHWLSTELGQYSTPGDPGRLAYLSALVFACRVDSDMRNYAGIEAAGRIKDGVIELLQNELDALLSSPDASVYEVAVVRRPLLLSYVGLREALSAPQDFGHVIEAAASPEGVWNDGLDPLRALGAKGTPQQETRHLRTLAELSWYVRWKKLDSATADVSSVGRVSYREVLAPLGAPSNLCIAEKQEHAILDCVVGAEDRLRTTLARLNLHWEPRSVTREPAPTPAWLESALQEAGSRGLIFHLSDGARVRLKSRAAPGLDVDAFVTDGDAHCQTVATVKPSPTGNEPDVVVHRIAGPGGVRTLTIVPGATRWVVHRATWTLGNGNQRTCEARVNSSD